MDFDTIKMGGFDGIASCCLIGMHNVRQLVGMEGTRLGCFNKCGHTLLNQNGFGFGCNGRWGHRLAAMRLQAGV